MAACGSTGLDYRVLSIGPFTETVAAATRVIDAADPQVTLHGRRFA